MGEAISNVSHGFFNPLKVPFQARTNVIERLVYFFLSMESFKSVSYGNKIKTFLNYSVTLYVVGTSKLVECFHIDRGPLKVSIL